VMFVAPAEAHTILGTPMDQRIVVPGQPFHTMLLPRTTATFDIGLVPLTPCLFNDAKSDLKGMEMAACGIPVIASAAEEYLDWIEPGDNGFLARKPRDWFDHLDALVNDPGLRRQMGRNARAKAATRTIQEHYTQWEHAWAA
jgi:glycosyltransferase involved in cell wall biosynthesis